MTTFVLGAAGALAALGLLALGAWVGWQVGKARGPAHLPRRENERERLAQEQAAFRQLQNYSVERAYGLVEDEEGERA